MCEKVIKTAFSPAVPMWAIFYDLETDNLFTEPVMAIAVIHEIDPEDPDVILSSYLEAQSLTDNSFFENPENEFNFIAYSFNSEPDREAWQEEIERVKRKK
jgi:hypothetical protein